MKQSEWKKVSTPLAERLPDFRRVRDGFALDAEWVSVCLLMDESRQRDRFYLHAFLLPHFIPTENIYFTYGKRLLDSRNAQFWSEFTDELLSLSVGAVENLCKPDPLAALSRIAAERPLDTYLLELRLCLALLVDDDRSYRKHLPLIENWHIEADYEIEILERCRRVAELVEVGGRSAALLLFADRRATVRKLLD